MKHSTSRTGLLASTVLCGAMSLGLAGAARAQTGPDAAVQELVVTGTRLIRADGAGVAPVSTLSHADIALSGATRIEDLLNTLPQVTPEQGAAIGNGASGTAAVNLRGLGVQRTLVLIDGRRMLPGDPGYAGHPPVPDLNFIPAMLLDRVEILNGGASSTYGSDAVAGVVNFILQKNFTGVKLDANAGFYDHGNGNGAIQGLAQQASAAYPTGSRADGWQKDVTLAAGANTPDGKGNATAYIGYRQIDAVKQSQRDYGACPLQESGAGFVCSGSPASAQSRFLVFTPLGVPVGYPLGYILDPTGSGNTVRTFSTARDSYNYAPYLYYQRPDERYTAGLLGRYKVNGHAQLYSQFMFMDDNTSVLAAPAGIFGQEVQLPCASPLLSAQEVATFCTQAGQGARGVGTLGVLKRNVEGGPRVTTIHHTDYRLLVGAKGDIDKTWSYDASIQYGAALMHETETNDFSLSRFANAVNGCVLGVVNPNGIPCATYNAFAIGAVTQAALNYVSASQVESGQTSETVAGASLTGKLGDYGLRSPWASDGVGVNVGAEYRRETLTLNTSLEDQTGDLASTGGVRVPASGAYDVRELYTEALIPIAQNRPGFKDLSMNLGYRYSDYSLSGRTDTYKIGGDWAPVSDLQLRAGYNRAVRAPNIDELFAPQGVVNDGSSDPCVGSKPTATLAQCALTGVTAAQYGHITANSAGQYHGLEGGNPNLQPEISDTDTVGAVFTPRLIPGLAASVDYFDIKVRNVIGTAGATLILTQCLQTGNPFYCGKINRAPGSGSLWLGSNGYVIDTEFNLGQLRTQGFDFNLTYRLPLAAIGWDRWGRVDVGFDGTLLNTLITQPLPTGASVDCAGLYGVICGVPSPKWKHKARLSWETPWAVTASAAWRHIGGVTVDSSVSNPFITGVVDAVDAKLPSMDYFDLAAAWRIKGRYTLRLGVNNVMDLQPPLVGLDHLQSTYGNGNTYPEVYDSLGRYVFMGLTAQF